ncbi:Bromodomain containing protein, partial [Aphelenchoides avenae]
MKTSFVYLAMKAKEKMNGVKNATDQEIGKLVKHLPTIDKNKKALQEVCSQIRMQIAQDVVDLCNAVIRRGNDLVTAIDLAEDAKTKQYTQSETELRIHKDRLSKIEQFATVGMHSTVFDDPTVVHACSFLESACHVVNSKRENVQANLIYSQKVPQLRYLSDATPLNNALRTFGALEIDGSIKTPQSTTHPQARMFSIATGSAQPHGSATQQRMTTPNGVRIRGPSVPMSTMAGGATISSATMPLAMPSHQNGHRMMMSNNNHAQYMVHRAAGSHVGSPTTLTPGTSPTSMMPVMNNHGGLRTHFPRLAPRMMSPSATNMMIAPSTPQSAATATASATVHIRPTATAVIPPSTGVIHQHGSARRKGHPERLTSEALNGDEVLAIDTPSTSTAAPAAEKSGAANAAVATSSTKTTSVSTGMKVSPARPSRTDSAPLASTQTGPGQVAGKKPSTSSDSGIASRPASSSAVEANGTAAKRLSAESGQTLLEAKRPCLEKVSGLNGLTSAAAFAPKSAVTDQEGPAEVAVPTDTSPTAPISCENSNGSHADAGEKEPEASTSAAPKGLNRQRSAATEQEEEGDENEETDAWDDYCFVCNQGCDEDTGELGCCAGCPRVYHNQCHVPRIHDKMANLP